MNFEDYREFYINNINNNAITSLMNPTDVFIEDVEDMLVNDFNMLNEINLCYFEWKNGTKMFKSMKIDAYSVDVVSNTVNLMIADFNDMEIQNITNEIKNNYSQLMLNFFENVLKGYFKGAEQSASHTQCSIEILKNIDLINKVHLFIVSTNKISERIKNLNLQPFTYQGRVYKVILDVIDFDRIYRAKAEMFEKEDIVVKTSDYGVSGIPCLKADLGTNTYDSYLAVVPGELLADIYDDYSSQLLESNVRSFLSFRGGINKGIRGTILNSREKFFTYNNGISATAKEVECQYIDGQGLVLTKLKGLQIINGGQTTASLASTRIKDKASLKNIFVQMKLTVVKEKDPDFIRNISKFANSQNKVTAADLNSNHPYYTRIEEFSRKIFAPTIGSTYQELWFFERARGQYEQPMMKMTTKKQRDDYQKVRPKDKKFTKTDLAKYINSAAMLPYYVSWGAEVNATKFQEQMEKEWNNGDSVYNEFYYKELIGKAILFKALEKIISAQEWYIENKAYRPQLVTYTFSKFVYEVEKRDLKIDYKGIWDKQAIPPIMEEELAIISKLAFDNIYDLKELANISSYCKTKICWERLKNKDYTLSSEIHSVLINKQDREIEMARSKKIQASNNKTSYALEIFMKGAEYWENLIAKAESQKVLNSVKDLSFLNAARDSCKNGNLVSDNQAAVIKNIVDELKKLGIE